MTPLNPALLEVLACPVCLASVSPAPSTDDPQELVCAQCGRRYPVRNGIPIMLVDEALGQPTDSSPPPPAS